MCVLVWFRCHCVLISARWTTLHATAPRWASLTHFLLAQSQVTWPVGAGAAKFAHRYWHPATARPQNLHTFYRLSQRIESGELTIVQKSAPPFLQLRPAVLQGPPPAQIGPTSHLDLLSLLVTVSQTPPQWGFLINESVKKEGCIIFSPFTFVIKCIFEIFTFL